MISVVTFKWKPNGYRTHFTAAHVNKLRQMVARHYPEPFRFLCVTDDPAGLDAEIEAVDLWSDYSDIPNPSFGEFGPSCYRRLRMFRGDFTLAGERFVSLDLDAVIVGDLRPLWNRPEDFVAWKDPSGRWPYNGSMMMLTAGARPQVWDDFDPRTSPQLANKSGALGSDQGWISYRIPHEATWSQADGVYSFRTDLRRGRMPLPANARVVFFHGVPKPWDVAAQGIRWIANAYR